MRYNFSVFSTSSPSTVCILPYLFCTCLLNSINVSSLLEIFAQVMPLFFISITLLKLIFFAVRPKRLSVVPASILRFSSSRPRCVFSNISTFFHSATWLKKFLNNM
uniref:Uncharacterized protein n=1 Tax=Uncultured archaeon GZfos26G2 TaxID=3386331 RepID=Q64CV5_UNCAG|nr:hypothetical protein GZ19C8_33 [uncultured archaeon GZfos19C8]